MYPPQTSLIPVTVALLRFFDTHGLASFNKIYPFWYLGVPYKFLIGPVVPVIFSGIKKIIPAASYFDISIIFLIFIHLISSMGWYLFVKRLTKKRGIAVVVGLLSVFLPWRLYSSIVFSEVSFSLARYAFPFMLIAAHKYLSKKNLTNLILFVIGILFLLLTNTGIIPIMLVGFASLLICLSYKKGEIKGFGKRAKDILKTLAVTFVLATVWYGTRYWFVILTNPSIGGATGYKVIFRIGDLFKIITPFAAAFFSVYFSKKLKGRFIVFAISWFYAFLFLTLFRFMGDPDFWQDWMTWLFEVEIGIMLVASRPIYSLYQKIRKLESYKYGNKAYTAIVFGILILFYIVMRVQVEIKEPIIGSEIPVGIASLEKVGEIAGESRVFLSGSSVFWANALYDTYQVRGGNDKVAIHPYWDHAAYQIREGEDPEISKYWLEALGVKYVLVHSDVSDEYYHDFQKIGKWQDIGEVIWKDRGDYIIKLNNSSFAWLGDKDLSTRNPPESGADENALSDYIKAKEENIDLSQNKQGIDIVFNSMLPIVVSYTYDLDWVIYGDVELQRDPLGSMLIIPKKDAGKIHLEY